MGAHLARLALVNSGHVHPRSARVLTFMALTALDYAKNNQDARLYYAGWEAMTVLFPTVSPASARRYVGLAIAELVDVGLVKPVADHTAPGQRQCYEITL